MQQASHCYILENTARLFLSEARPIPVPDAWLPSLVAMQNAILLAPQRLQSHCHEHQVESSPFESMYERLQYAMNEGVIPVRYWHMPVFVVQDFERLRDCMAAPDNSFDDPIEKIDAILNAFDQKQPKTAITPLLKALDQYSLSHLSTATFLYFTLD